MEALPRIWVDWNENWGEDLVSLNLPNTVESFKLQGISMQPGRRIRLFGDRLEAEAVIVEDKHGSQTSLMAKIVAGTLNYEPPP